MKERKTNKKSTMLVLVALLLVFAMSVGTIAWLTRTDTVVNSFTVGDISEPTVEDDLPDVKDPENKFDSTVDGNIWEPSWDEQDGHIIAPATTIPKDPYVGIGKGSEDSVVYLYVDNDFDSYAYFTINDGWEAVQNETKTITVEGVETAYVSGLFKYTAGLKGAAENDVWTTTPLFSNVNVIKDVTKDQLTGAVTGNDSSAITVYAYIHQAKGTVDGATNADVPITVDDVKAALGIK